MMSDQADNLSNLIETFGLTDEESRLYLYLLQHGFTTALTLLRRSRMRRTQGYRILDLLKKLKLVEKKNYERGGKILAKHPSRLQQIVIEREQNVQALKKTLPDLISRLSTIMPASTEKSKVLYYEGIEGLEQVSYNIVHANGLLRVFEMEHLDNFLSFEFSESIRRRLVENKILTRDLTNKKQFPGFTDVADLVQQYSEFRYISPDKLKINFEVLIYNDVYATYTYKDKKIFCVEIYNEQLATMQKHIFDFIWAQAKPMKFVDMRGAARLQ